MGRKDKRLGLMILAAATLGLAGLVWGGCGDDSPGEGDADGAVDGAPEVDGGVDGAPQVDSGVDGGDAGQPETTCLTELVLDTDFDLDPQGDDTQIHANVQFDGEAVWLVYNLPDVDSGFDVYGARLHCDGSYARAPVRLNEVVSGNDIDPDLGVDADHLYVAWSTDNGQFPYNMDVYYRTFTRDGTALMDEELTLETTRDGTAVVGNVMFPAVTALPADTFVVAACRGLDETGTFQTFVQEIDADGTLHGAAKDAFVEVGVGHSYPTMAFEAPDVLHLAWVRTENNVDDSVVQTRFTGDATIPQPVSPVEAVAGVTGGAPSSCLTQDGEQTRLYLAIGAASGNILLTDGGAYDPQSEVAYLGDVAHTDHSPVVACGPEGGVVVFYRNLGGFDNEVIAQPFTYDGVAFEVGEEVVVTEGPAPPYQPAVTRVGPHIYFAAWSVGENPAFRLKGRFFQSE